MDSRSGFDRQYFGNPSGWNHGMDAYISHSSHVPYLVWRRWFFRFPVDGDGVPTSDAAYQLLRYLFVHHHEAQLSETVAENLMLHPELVRCMCRQLEIVDLLQQDPAGSGRYRYMLDSPNTELQRKVELALLDYPRDAAQFRQPRRPLG